MKIRSGVKTGMGLGDVIALACEKTGLAACAKKYEQVTGQDCGCKKRQALLNGLPLELPIILPA